MPTSCSLTLISVNNTPKLHIYHIILKNLNYLTYLCGYKQQFYKQHHLMLMKTSTFSAIAVLCALSPLSANANFFVEPAPLPSIVSAVNPEQGLIDTGGSATPLGAKAYSITFPSNNVVQNDVDANFELYRDGVLVATTPATKNNVDIQNDKIYCFTFPGTWLSNGVYRVDIPAGVWTVDGTEVPAFSLNYEIFSTMTLSPAPGTYTSLQDFRIDFKGASKVVCNKSTLSLGLQNSSKSYAFTILTKDNYVLLDLDTPITAPGTYSLELPKGLFTVTYDGKPGVAGSTESATLQSEDVILQYYVSSLPAPTIDPAEGEVESFYQFTVTAPAELDAWFADEMSRGKIYPVLPDGTLAGSPLCQLRVSQPGAGNIAVMTVLNQDLSLATEPLVPSPGKYCVVLPADLFTGMYNGNYTTTVPYYYYYTVKAKDINSAVESVETEMPAVYGVYNMQGVKVADEAGNLPKGLYIVDGKKVLVK